MTTMPASHAREPAPDWDAILPFWIFPNPVDLLVPRLHRRLPGVQVPLILAGQHHDPVVYFARVGRAVKIGTTANLRKRMAALYLDLDDVLAVMPGDRRTEDAYHVRFRGSRIKSPGRNEVFGMDARLRLYLARCRCTWAEAVAAFLITWTAGMALMLVMVPWVLGAAAGVAAYLMSMAVLFMRPGWNWQ